MIGLMKLYACILITVLSLVKFIDASCMSYGHSCWGAHGKRSNIQPREMRLNEPDRWAMFRLNDRDGFFPFKKVMRDNQQIYPTDNDGSLLPISQPFTSYDDDNAMKPAEELFDDNEEFKNGFRHIAKRANKPL